MKSKSVYHSQTSCGFDSIHLPHFHWSVGYVLHPKLSYTGVLHFTSRGGNLHKFYLFEACRCIFKNPNRNLLSPICLGFIKRPLSMRLPLVHFEDRPPSHLLHHSKVQIEIGITQDRQILPQSTFKPQTRV